MALFIPHDVSREPLTLPSPTTLGGIATLLDCGRPFPWKRESDGSEWWVAPWEEIPAPVNERATEWFRTQEWGGSVSLWGSVLYLSREEAGGVARPRTA